MLKVKQVSTTNEKMTKYNGRISWLTFYQSIALFEDIDTGKGYHTSIIESYESDEFGITIKTLNSEYKYLIAKENENEESRSI